MAPHERAPYILVMRRQPANATHTAAPNAASSTPPPTCDTIRLNSRTTRDATAPHRADTRSAFPRALLRTNARAADLPSHGRDTNKPPPTRTWGRLDFVRRRIARRDGT